MAHYSCKQQEVGDSSEEDCLRTIKLCYQNKTNRWKIRRIKPNLSSGWKQPNKQNSFSVTSIRGRDRSKDGKEVAYASKTLLFHCGKISTFLFSVSDFFFLFFNTFTFFSFLWVICNMKQSLDQGNNIQTLTCSSPLVNVQQSVSYLQTSVCKRRHSLCMRD